MKGSWRDEPATEKQKEKLRFFGCTWKIDITKGEASDAISKCVAQFPEIEEKYRNRPATKDQRAQLRKFKIKPEEDPDDPLTYEEAKELIKEAEFEKQIEQEERELEELDREYVVDVDMWSDIYPGLTWKRVQSAAKALDISRPGWRSDGKHFDIMLEKVVQQSPQLLGRWRNKGVRGSKSRGRMGKSGCFGVVVFLIFVVWILSKIISTLSDFQ